MISDRNLTTFNRWRYCQVKNALIRWAIGLGGFAAACLSGSAAGLPLPQEVGGLYVRMVGDLDSDSKGAGTQTSIAALTSSCAGDGRAISTELTIHLRTSDINSATSADVPAYLSDFRVPRAEANLFDGDTFRVSLIPGIANTAPVEAQPIVPVPEPTGATALAGLALAGLLKRGRRGRAG